MTLKLTIVRLADGTRTAREIAETLQCRDDYVYRAVKQHGGKLRSRDPDQVKRTYKRASSSKWTPEREQLVRSLWGAGLSAGQIAARLNCGLSRNAVIGKLHRLGLTDADRGKASKDAMQVIRRIKSKPKPPRPKRTPFRPPILPVEPYKMGPEPVVPEAERRSVSEVLDGQCRWPIGDPLKPDFHFCNGRQIEGQSYCFHHLLRSVQERERPALVAKFKPPPAATGEGIDETASRSFEDVEA